MSWKKLKGFTLVEMLTTLAVTAVVMTGVVATFTKVSKGAENTSKGAALTSTARGLADLLSSDFSNAGRGFADLIALDIRFSFHPDFYTLPSGTIPDPNMYGIAGLSHEPSSNTSEITLHWFDYDVRNSPSYLFSTTDSTWANGTTTYTAGTFFTNKTDELSKLVTGDIVLIYSVKPQVEREENGKTIWNSEDINNQALILQVRATTGLEVGPIEANNGRNGMAGKVEVTFEDGPIFSYTLANPIEGTYAPVSGLSEFLLAEKARNDGYKMPVTHWMARKLGDADSFNRVTYRVVPSDEPGGPSVLARTHNGQHEIVATDIAKFVVSLGLDVHPGDFTDNEGIEPPQINGRVSALDPAAWTKGKDRSWGSISEPEYKIAIGRHALQARVEFSQLGAQDKNEARTGNEIYRKSRGFLQQYRLRNISLPIGAR